MKMSIVMSVLIILAAGASFLAAGSPSRPAAPAVEPLFDYPVRDTCVCLGPDGIYYLTGTTGAPTWWQTNEGIRLWRSKDRKQWQPMGLVWSFAQNASWQKPQIKRNANGTTQTLQALWAPELHYLKNTFWITYCMNYGGTGLLKSTTGKAEGPYVDLKPDGPLTGEIDASLFQDDDEKVYFVFQDGKIARLKDDLSGLAESPHLLRPRNGDHVGFEGAFIFKREGRYYLICAELNGPLYDCMAASADHLLGPYGDRYLAIPHGGHNMFFMDAQGKWWSTFFGNDNGAPFRERPAILRVGFDKNGRIQPLETVK